MNKPYRILKAYKPDGTLVESEDDFSLQEPPVFITRTLLSRYFDVRSSDTLEDVIARAQENHRTPDTPPPSSGPFGPNSTEG